MALLGIWEERDKQMIKKTKLFLMEELLYISFLAYLLTRYSECFGETSTVAMFNIPAVGIAAVNLAHILLDIKLKPRLVENNKASGKWLYRFTLFILIIIVSYASFSALEYFGNIPASFRTLLIVSLMLTTSHLMLNLFADATQRWADWIY